MNIDPAIKRIWALSTMVDVKQESPDATRASSPVTVDESSHKPVIRIILADSQAIYRVGVRKIFALEDNIRVVAQVDTLDNLRAAIDRFPTDILLLEGSLVIGTIDAIPDLVRHAPQIRIIVQAMASEESNMVELYRCGVRGVIPRSISPDLLVKCVRKIAAGETWINNQSINSVIEAYRSQASVANSPKSRPHLSPKELSVIACITQAKRNKEIADQLGTTEQVIKNYLRSIYNKLGVSDRLELAMYSLHHQLDTKVSGDSPTAKLTNMSECAKL